MSGANGGLNVSIGGNTISHLIPLTLRVSHTPAIEIGSCFFSIFVSGKRACEDIQLVVAMCVDARYFIRRRFVFVQSSTSGGQQRRWNVLPLNFSNLRSYETEGNEKASKGERRARNTLALYRTGSLVGCGVYLEAGVSFERGAINFLTYHAAFRKQHIITTRAFRIPIYISMFNTSEIISRCGRKNVFFTANLNV